jgi:hypothetical protein
VGFFKRKAYGVVAQEREMESAPPEVNEIIDDLIERGVLEDEPVEPHPLRSENYEPRFPRLSVTRRVLGHITPEVDHDDLGPRNTLNALTVGLISDPHTEISYPEQVQPYLDDLVESGLVSEHAGTYQVTEAGWRELTN